MKTSGVYMTEEQIAEKVKCFEYVRGEHKEPIGVVVLDNEFRIGWSLYNDEAEADSYFGEPATKDKGIMIALSRAEHVLDPVSDLEEKIRKAAHVCRPSRLERVYNYVAKMIRRRTKLV